MANNRRNTGQQSAERHPHQKAQRHQLPCGGDKRLWDQQRRAHQQSAAQHAPVADAVGQLAQPRRGKNAAQRGSGHHQSGGDGHRPIPRDELPDIKRDNWLNRHIGENQQHA